MAFSIPLDPHDTGLVCTYWRITQAQIDHLHGAVTVWLHGWRDSDARTTGRTPAGSLTLHLTAADLPDGDTHNATTAALYQAVRSRAAAAGDEFSRAIGVIEPRILAAAHDC